jgi:hypothetical protein
VECGNRRTAQQILPIGMHYLLVHRGIQEGRATKAVEQNIAESTLACKHNSTIQVKAAHGTCYALRLNSTTVLAAVEGTHQCLLQCVTYLRSDCHICQALPFASAVNDTTVWRLWARPTRLLSSEALW